MRATSDRPVHHGTVTEFEAGTGVGVVVDAASGRSYEFHATQIVGGARTIAVNATVSFSLAPGGRGRYEAVDVRQDSTGNDGSFPCPACASPVEGVPGAYEICGACGWEDDPVQRDDPGYAGGANGESLNDARIRLKRQQLS